VKKLLLKEWSPEYVTSAIAANNFGVDEMTELQRVKESQEYATTGLVARYCGVSKVTVLRWIKKGYLKAFKLPEGQNRIHNDDLSAFITKYGIPVKKHLKGNK